MHPFPAIGHGIPQLAIMADALAITRTMALALANLLAKVDPLEPTNDTTPEEEPLAMTGTYPIVGARGFEPPTPRSRTECATRLRYAPLPLTSFTRVNTKRPAPYGGPEPL